MLKSVPMTVRLMWVAVILGGCSILSQAGDVSGYRDFSVSAGETTMHDLYIKTARILNRDLFEIVRQEESTQLVYLETRWQFRPPFEDEQAQGIAEARTRLIVRARLRRAAVIAGGSNLYTVQITAENMVQLIGAEEWSRITNTPMYKAYIRNIAKELENEFRMSMRRF